MALIITISYTLSAEGDDPVDNSTNVPSTFALENNTESVLNGSSGGLNATTLEAFQVLLLLNWPLEGNLQNNNAK